MFKDIFKEPSFQPVVNNISTRYQHQVINTVSSPSVVKEYNILGRNVKVFFNFFKAGTKGAFYRFFWEKMTKRIR